ncbi:MAG TPA: alkaline phosphatase family protein, partial [Thermoanaerobaculia bacterium]|nr:alkaline phosphatase family protein [Thermoanaerobaculia bacterium]
VNLNNGVIFIVWDEGSSTAKIPFLAVGPGVKTGYTGSVTYDHGSIIKSVEEVFGLPLLSTVSGKNDLADLFNAGFFP